MRTCACPILSVVFRLSTFTQVCRTLLRATEKKSLWIHLLICLDYTCAPDIPPHVNIDSLSYDKVRSIVVDAVRSYVHVTDGADVTYEVRHRILLECASGSVVSETGSPYGGDTMRLSPGGRYFFIVLADPHVAKRLQIYDLHDGGRCIWFFEAVCQLLDFDFECRQDGSILVAVAHTTSMYSGPADGWAVW